MDQKKYIGQQIRKYREEKGLTAEELGSMLKTKRGDSTVTSWERGRTQCDGDTLIELCTIFGVDISEFYFKPQEYIDAVIAETDEPYVEVPLYGAIAAGSPIEMIEVDETFVIPTELKQKYPRSYLLKVKGESMNKVLPNGSFALINQDSPVINGRAYAVCVNGFDATIKRVYKLDNGYELRPDSTDPTIKPKVYDYGIDGTDEITVLGQVVWYTVPFDFVV